MADSPIVAFIGVFALAGVVYLSILAINFVANVTKKKGLALSVGAAIFIAGWVGLRMLSLAI